MKTKTAAVPWLAMLALLSACNNQSPDNVFADQGDTTAINQGESVFCEVVEQRVSRDDCEDLTRADAEVRPGAAAFNVPDPMRRGQTVEVHLVIDRRSPRAIRVVEEFPKGDASTTDLNMSFDSADTNISSDLPDTNTATGAEDPPQPGTDTSEGTAPTPGQIVERLEGSPERFYPPVGRHMRAELVGQGFEIVPNSDLSQEIPLGGQASWIWKVTARQGGRQSLTLVTVVEGVTNGRRFVLARTPRVRTVTVDVSLRDRVWDALVAAPNWIKAVTAVVVAFSGFLATWYGLPRRKRRKISRTESQPEVSVKSDDSGASET